MGILNHRKEITDRIANLELEYDEIMRKCWMISTPEFSGSRSDEYVDLISQAMELRKQIKELKGNK